MALCVLSAVGFGAMAAFAKWAYGAGFEVATLLALRFLVAAILFWGIVAALRIRMPERRTVLAGLAMGAVGYAAQAGLYFGTLTRLDASLTALLLYTYPGLVFLAAVLLGRDKVTAVRLGALGLATVGTVLVLFGGDVGALDGLGVTMGVAAALVYTTYILVADRVLGDADPFALAALVMTGATVATVAATLAFGGFSFDVDPAGWASLAGVACVSTVLAVSAFFVGMRMVGPSTASIVSTVEPVVTVSLALALFGESLGPAQLLGGVLVLGAVVLLQLRPGTVASDVPADHAAAPAPARALAREPA